MGVNDVTFCLLMLLSNVDENNHHRKPCVNNYHKTRNVQAVKDI